MTNPDLRILALADTKLLPPAVQEPFDHWRIWRARDAVAAAVRRRLNENPMLQLFVERLEVAEDERGIFEGIYALAEAVDVHRSQIGLHSQYIIVIMAGQLNPWGLLSINRDYDNPTPSVVKAAQELWRLAREQNVDIPALLAQLKDNEPLRALEAFYKTKPLK